MMRIQKKKTQYHIKISLLFTGLLIFLWLSVLLIHGILGAGAWIVIKMILPFVGIIGFIISFIGLIRVTIKKKQKWHKVMQCLLYGVMIFPITFLFGLIDMPYPVKIQQASPSITIRWPLTERSVVGWGGDLVKMNLPHAIWASERWAYDLVMLPYETGSRKNEDYGIWDKKVIAPISGIVVEAYDEEEDITPGTEDFTSMEGNHVYIKIEQTNTYLLLNHLKKGSVTVNTGDYVKEGDIIGLVGNSGSSSEPHLHIHHQKQDPTKHFLIAEGLPLYFKDINTKPMPEKGMNVIPKP